jgi:hypothetical protein
MSSDMISHPSEDGISACNWISARLPRPPSLGVHAVSSLTWPMVLARRGRTLTVYPSRASARICASRIHCPLLVRTGGEGCRIPDSPGPPRAVRLYPTGPPPSRRPTSSGLGRGGPSSARVGRGGPPSVGIGSELAPQYPSRPSS